MSKEHFNEERRPMVLINSDRPWMESFTMDCLVKIRNSVICEAPTGRNYIYGCSAFGTVEAADRRRRSLMIKWSSNWYNQRFCYESVERCRLALERMK